MTATIASTSTRMNIGFLESDFFLCFALARCCARFAPTFPTATFFPLGVDFIGVSASFIRLNNEKPTRTDSLGVGGWLHRNSRADASFVKKMGMPVAGVEPARYRYHWILSPARLPIPSHRRINYYITSRTVCQEYFVSKSISGSCFFRQGNCFRNLLCIIHKFQTKSGR